MRRALCAAAALLGLIALGRPDTAGAQGGPRFEITITNLTRNQTFTPVFVAVHRPGVRLFELGRPAIPQLAVLAEEGDVAPLMTLANQSPLVLATTFTGAPPGGFVPPGQSRTVSVPTTGAFDRLTMAAMLIPTNDGFFALRDVEGPSGNNVLVLTAPAYDSGTERNDETCASIPGPNFAECGGPGGGGQPAGGEEGYVYIHHGIQGVGNFTPSRDWRNPVAQITIRRVP